MVQDREKCLNMLTALAFRGDTETTSSAKVKQKHILWCLFNQKQRHVFPTPGVFSSQSNINEAKINCQIIYSSFGF